MANGTLKVENIQTSSGSGTITLGQSGETIALGSGVTSKMNQPAFQAYLSSAQSVTDDTDTKVQCDTESFDTDNCYDNSTNYRFTPTVSGKYLFQCAMIANAGTTNLQSTILRLKKNGTTVAIAFHNSDGNFTNQATCNLNVTLDANGSTDYFEIFAQINDTSGNPTVYGNTYPSTYFAAYRIGVE